MESKNVIINSEKNLDSSSYPNRGTLRYYIDWDAVFASDPETTQYEMTWAFTSSSQILQGNYTYQIFMSSLSSNQFTPGTTSGMNGTQCIGALKYGSNLGTNQLAYLSTNLRDNPPIYLNSRPTQNEFTITIRNTVNDGLFSDDQLAITSAGTATLSETTLTIATVSSGSLIIGTNIVLSGTTYKIVGYGTGNGGTGTYIVDKSGSVGTATAYNIVGRNELGPYSLVLNFCRVN